MDFLRRRSGARKRPSGTSPIPIDDAGPVRRFECYGRKHNVNFRGRMRIIVVELEKAAGGEALITEPEDPAPDGFKPFYDALRGRYAVLDLDACTGATLAYYDRMQQDFSRRQDRDKIVSLVLPAGTRRAGFRAFAGCSSLESVVMPAGLRSIGQYAFAGCTSLKQVELPASLTQIDFAAFQGCRALASVAIHAETPPVMLSGGIDNWFGNVSGDLVITVPAGSVEAYKAADGWRQYAEKIQGMP